MVNLWAGPDSSPRTPYYFNRSSIIADAGRFVENDWRRSGGDGPGDMIDFLRECDSVRDRLLEMGQEAAAYRGSDAMKDEGFYLVPQFEQRATLMPVRWI